MRLAQTLVDPSVTQQVFRVFTGKCQTNAFTSGLTRNRARIRPSLNAVNLTGVMPLAHSMDTGGTLPHYHPYKLCSS